MGSGGRGRVVSYIAAILILYVIKWRRAAIFLIIEWTRFVLLTLFSGKFNGREVWPTLMR